MSPEEYKVALEIRKAEDIKRRHNHLYCVYKEMQRCIKQAGLNACLPTMARNTLFCSTIFMRTKDGIRFRTSLPRVGSLVQLFDETQHIVRQISNGEYQIARAGQVDYVPLGQIEKVIRW